MDIYLSSHEEPKYQFENLMLNMKAWTDLLWWQTAKLKDKQMKIN
jgi:hypothetical protein